jgi:antitoxin VapB
MRIIEHSKNKIKLARKKEDVYLPSTKEAPMGALNIKDKAVAEKARRLAKLKGTTITEAVAEALEASLRTAEHRSKLDRAARERRVDEIVKRFQASIPPDAPSYEEIMEDMYDENGLPK